MRPYTGRGKAGHMAAQAAQQEGTGFIYGKNAVAELLKSGTGADTVYIQDTMAPRCLLYTSRRKLNRRFFLVTALAVCLTLVLTAGICYEMFRAQVMKDLAACAHLLAAEGTVLPREEAVLGQDGLRVTLIGPDGGVLYDTDAAAAQMESHSNRPEVQQAQQTGEGSAVRRSSTLGQNTFYLSLIHICDAMYP